MLTVRVVLLLLGVFVADVAAQSYNPELGTRYFAPACYRLSHDFLFCQPALVELSTPQRYAISEAVIGAPHRERAFLILVNLDMVFPRYVQVDVTLPGEAHTYRLVRLLPPFGRETVALDQDPLFMGRVTAVALQASFESYGHATLVTRPAADLWAGETIVAGVKVEGGAR